MLQPHERSIDVMAFSPAPLSQTGQLVSVGTNWLTSDRMLPAFRTIPQEVLLGFAVAIVTSLSLVVGAGSMSLKAVMPYPVAVITLPGITFASLFVAKLGFSTKGRARCRQSSWALHRYPPGARKKARSTRGPIAR